MSYSSDGTSHDSVTISTDGIVYLVPKELDGKWRSCRLAVRTARSRLLPTLDAADTVFAQEHRRSRCYQC